MSDKFRDTFTEVRGVVRDRRPRIFQNTIINLPDDFDLYRYSVTIKDYNEKNRMKELTKGAGDDHSREAKRAKCYELFRQVVDDNKGFFQKPFMSLYDRRKMFFSKVKLPIKTGDSKKFDVRDRDTGHMVTVSFEPTEPESINVSDVESLLMEDLDMRTRDQQQILEVLTSQVIFYKEKYVQFGRNFMDTSGWENPAKDLGGGKYLASGYSKGARIIEGTEPDNPSFALQIDQKKTAVYKPQNVVKSVADTLRVQERELNRELTKVEREIILQSYRGVVVETKTGKKFEIQGITPSSALKTDFEFMDRALNAPRMLSVALYFAEVKKCNLKLPKLNCLVERKQGGENSYYPMEVCKVCPNQRVPLIKQTPEQMQNSIKKCALKPSDREAELAAAKKETEVLSNEFLRELGVRMSADTVKMTGRVIPAPMIQNKDAKLRVNNDGNWDMNKGRWYQPAKCGSWGCLRLDLKCDPKVLMSFLSKFTSQAAQTGIEMGANPELADCTSEELESSFKWGARDGKLEYILLIVFGKDNALKDRVKWLEQKYDIVTQVVRSQTVQDIGNPLPDRRTGRPKNWMGTLLNILAKTNMKLGGMNFMINLELPTDKILRKWFSGNVMYLGVDVNHPPPQSLDERRLGIPPKEPSVIGMVGSSPGLHKQFIYTGEHWFQDPRIEKITAMTELTKEFLARWNRRAQEGQKLPEKVILFRDGVSEGQYKMLIQEEIPALKKAFALVAQDYSPPLTVVVVLKRHTMRMMNEKLNPAHRATQQDIPVGSVVDHTVVNPANWEFYLQSHRAIQGTAKCSKYCVVLDENGFSQNEIEGVAYVLAHNHQIVSKSVSLPAPVYGADEMAERGKRLFRAENSGSESSSSGFSSDGNSDWEEFSMRHRVGGTSLESRKHWA